MIIIRLSGGLGNQMFQYAFAKSLSILHPEQSFSLDISSFQGTYRKYDLQHFCVDIPIADNKNKAQLLDKEKTFLNKFREKYSPYYKKIKVEEQYYHFDKKLLEVKQNALINGYFQSEKYFKVCEKEIRENFQFRKNPLGDNSDMLATIQNTANAVSIHIRRGDFVGNSLHPLQSEFFFKESISILQAKASNLHLFLFSNDVAWVKEYLHFDVPYTIVDINNEENGFEDLRLMSCCQHHIIANSSFSWWGAWLNPNPNKIVVAPAKWVDSQSVYYQNLDDIIPESWIKI